MPGGMDPFFINALTKGMQSGARRRRSSVMEIPPMRGGGGAGMRLAAPFMGQNAPQPTPETSASEVEQAPQIRSEFLARLENDPEYATAKSDYLVQKKWLDDPPFFHTASEINRRMMLMADAQNRMSQARQEVYASTPAPERFDFSKDMPRPDESTGVLTHGTVGTYGTFQKTYTEKPREDVQDENRNVWTQNKIGGGEKVPKWGMEAPAGGESSAFIQERAKLTPEEIKAEAEQSKTPSEIEKNRAQAGLYGAQAKQALAEAGKTGAETAKLDPTKISFKDRVGKYADLQKGFASIGVITDQAKAALQEYADQLGIGVDANGGFIDKWGSGDRTGAGTPAPTGKAPAKAGGKQWRVDEKGNVVPK